MERLAFLAVVVLLHWGVLQFAPIHHHQRFAVSPPETILEATIITVARREVQPDRVLAPERIVPMIVELPDPLAASVAEEGPPSELPVDLRSPVSLVPDPRSIRVAGANRSASEYNVEVPTLEVRRAVALRPSPAGMEGLVQLAVFVESDGSVARVRLERSSGDSSLDTAAQHYAASWHLRPGRRNGTAVAMWASFAVSFSRNAVSVTPSE